MKFMRLFRGIFWHAEGWSDDPTPTSRATAGLFNLDVSKRCSQQALALVDNINKTLMPPKSPITVTWSMQSHPPLLQSKPGKQNHHGTKMPRDRHASFTLSVSSPFSSPWSASTCFSERHFMADTAGTSNLDRCDCSHRISSGRWTQARDHATIYCTFLLCTQGSRKAHERLQCLANWSPSLTW
jgi:hypothetical protein